MKKIIKSLSLFALVALCLLILPACGLKPRSEGTTSDDKLFYEVKDLGFSLTMPKSMENYTTRRRQASDFLRWELLVPTSDRNIELDAPNYSRIIEIRVYDQDKWGVFAQTEEAQKDFTKVHEEDGKVYALRFWANVPGDWRPIWGEPMRQELLDGLKFN